MYDPFGFLSGFDRVTARIRGHDYPYWSAVNIKFGEDQDAATFDLQLATEWSRFIADVPLGQRPEEIDPVEIYIGSDLVITGVIDNLDEDLNGTSHSVRIAGKGQSGAMLNFACTAFKDGWFKELSLRQAFEQIAAPFGVEVEFENGVNADEVIPYHHLDHGETAQHAMESLCRMRGLLVSGGTRSNIRITQAGDERSAGALYQPGNIKSFSVKRDASELGSHYYADGSNADVGGTDEVGAARRSGAVTDPVVAAKAPFRKVVVPAKGNYTHEAGNGRAANEMRRRRAKAIQATAVVPGWRVHMTRGPLWQSKTLVETRVRDLTRPVDAMLLIKAVSFSMSESQGQTASLELSPPENFKAAPPSGATQGGGGGGASGVGSRAGSSGTGWFSDVAPQLHDPEDR